MFVYYSCVLNLEAIFIYICISFESELSLETAHEHLSTEFLNVHKNNMGHDLRKTVFCLRTTKAQTSLHIRSD